MVEPDLGDDLEGESDEELRRPTQPNAVTRKEAASQARAVAGPFREEDVSVQVAHALHTPDQLALMLVRRKSAGAR